MDSRTDVTLVLDYHFCDLTPLNKPKGEIVAELVEPYPIELIFKDLFERFAVVVAVTGLAGHAFGSWKSRETHQMWLKDFLPKRVKNIGYDSSLVGCEKSESELSDYRRNFIQQLENSRSAVEVYTASIYKFGLYAVMVILTRQTRPIIFLGHSMGGILILQVSTFMCRNSFPNSHSWATDANRVET
jgi:hypothetical protein